MSMSIEIEEATGVNFERLKTIGRDLIHALGEDPNREGLKETPERWAKMWREFIEYDPGKIETAFASIEADQMVVLRGIRVFTFCEHHLLPFSLIVAIGYIAEKKVLGLS